MARQPCGGIQLIRYIHIFPGYSPDFCRDGEKSGTPSRKFQNSAYGATMSKDEFILPADAGITDTTPDTGASKGREQDFFMLSSVAKANVPALAQHVGERYKFIYTQANGWSRYQGDGKWKPESEHSVMRLVRDEVNVLAKEHGPAAELSMKPRLLKEILDYLKLDCEQDFLPAMHPDLIPMPNAQLLWDNSLQEFRVITPSPDYYVVHTLTVPYDPTAACPRFSKAVEMIMPNPMDRLVTQMYLGAALFPLNYTRKMLVFVGEGSSGKSLLVLLLSKILGRARVFDLKFENLSEKFALASLTRENSLLSGTEAIARTLCGRGGEWAKRLVGGDEFAAQQKYKNESLEYAGRYSVIIVSNNKLRFEFESNGQEWRDRLLPIFFRKSIPEAEQDKELPDKLYSEEGPGILNWLLEGARMVRRANWKITLSKVQEIDRDNLIAFSDPIKSFVAEFIMPNGYCFLSHDAYELYNRLSKEWHFPFIEEAKFFRGLAEQMSEQHGATVSHNLRGFNGKPARGYHGFDLKTFPDNE